MDKKIFVTTGAGNFISGGSDVWVNNWVEEITELLHYQGLLLIDNNIPKNVDPQKINPLKMLFFYGDRIPEVRDEVLEKTKDIHILHSHYTKKDFLIRHIDKVKSIVLHVDVPEIIECFKFYGFKEDPHQYFYDKDWFNYLLKNIDKKIWVGVNPNKNFINIPNYYEFNQNRSLIENNSIGFGARPETRKALHFLKNHNSFAFTQPDGFRDWEKFLGYPLSKTKLIQFNYKYIDKFYGSPDWGIFHGAYYKEPFGYSIFQSIDYGKLPIISHDWCLELDYKYRASTHDEFDNIVDIIKGDSFETKENEFKKIKNYLVSNFGNKQRWIKQMLNIYNG